jgi:protein phosphatase 4 regulatory subunit 3
MENFPQTILLPSPALSNLPEIDSIMRSATTSPQGRDSLGKFVVQEDYVRRIVPLVEEAEDLEDLDSLHRLSSIMKTFILLNDTQIIEHMMSDGIVDGVVGALECRTFVDECL